MGSPKSRNANSQTKSVQAKSTRVKVTRARTKSDIFLVISAAILVVTVIFAIATRFSGQYDRLFFAGYKPYFVTTTSMETTIKKHAFVIIKKKPFSKIKVGDAVAHEAYTKEGELRPIFTRVIEKDKLQLITRADNPAWDEEYAVSESSVVGVSVWHTNFTAYLYDFATSPAGPYVLIGVPLAIIATLAIFAFYRRKKQPKDVENTKH